MAPAAAAAPQALEPERHAPDPETLNVIERQLARQLGPIAARLVRQAQRQATSVADLCERVAVNIEDEPARARFLAELDRALGHRDPSAPPTSVDLGPGVQRAPTTARLTEAELDAVRKELARYLGPIATLMVRRSALTAASVNELKASLAPLIEREDDRAAFLARDK
jgi:serine/threonine-protein kinase